LAVTFPIYAATQNFLILEIAEYYAANVSWSSRVSNSIMCFHRSLLLSINALAPGVVYSVTFCIDFRAVKCVYEAPNNVPKSFRLDIRLTYGFTDFSAICEKSPRVKRALNSPTISEIVNRGIVLAIREWNRRDKKAGSS
jgi:hypothetical protein